VHWLLLVKFVYNNRIHTCTSVTPFFAKKSCQTRIGGTILSTLADKTFFGMLVNAWAEKLVELKDAIEQCWKKVTATH
jgi:hypothetical protein